MIDRAEAAAAQGLETPAFALEGVIEQAEKVVTGAPFTEGDASDLWADFESEVATLLAEIAAGRGRKQFSNVNGKLMYADARGRREVLPVEERGAGRVQARAHAAPERGGVLVHRGVAKVHPRVVAVDGHGAQPIQLAARGFRRVRADVRAALGHEQVDEPQCVSMSR